jgi:hypothetical protein
MLQSTLAPGQSQVLFSNLALAKRKTLRARSIEGELVTRRLIRLGSVVTLVVAVAVVYHEIRPDSLPVSRSPLPERPAARIALEKSLGRWRDSLESEAREFKPLEVVFVDQQRQPGQRLRAFTVLGDFELESCRCFKVRLDLTEPEESILAVYYVFGRDPMWVYRAEDFDRIMHWEMDMSNTTKAAIDSEYEAQSKSEHTEPGPEQPVTKRERRAAP